MKTYITKRDKQILAIAFLVAVVVNVLLWLVAGQLGLALAMAVDFLLFALAAAYLFRRDEALRIYERDVASNYFQTEALFNLFHVLSFDAPLPRFRNWAVSPDCCQELVTIILARNCETIVECGSGISTLFSAKALQKLGRGHVYSFESSEDYAAQTRARLAQHGLTDYATVITAPLTDVKIGDSTYQWYDTNKFELLPNGIDLLFVDGPPALRPDSRYPAFPLLKSRLARHVTIVVDDYVREGEQSVVRQWLQSENGFQFTKTEIPTEKGTCILQA